MIQFRLRSIFTFVSAIAVLLALSLQFPVLAWVVAVFAGAVPSRREQATAIWDESVEQGRVTSRTLLIPFLLGFDESLRRTIELRKTGQAMQPLDGYLIDELSDAELLNKRRLRVRTRKPVAPI